MKKKRVKDTVKCVAHTSIETKEKLRKLEREILADYADSVRHILYSHGDLSTRFTSVLSWMPNLNHIYFKSCNIQSLAGIGVCNRLEALQVPDNHITELPLELVNSAETLKDLDLSGNPIVALPDFICRLKRLKVLHLGNMCITGLPEDIGNLTFLKILDIRQNSITDLPASFSNLRVRFSVSCTHDYVITIFAVIEACTAPVKLLQNVFFFCSLVEAHAKIRL